VSLLCHLVLFQFAVEVPLAVRSQCIVLVSGVFTIELLTAHARLQRLLLLGARHAILVWLLLLRVDGGLELVDGL